MTIELPPRVARTCQRCRWRCIFATSSVSVVVMAGMALVVHGWASWRHASELAELRRRQEPTTEADVRGGGATQPSIGWIDSHWKSAIDADRLADRQFRLPSRDQRPSIPGLDDNAFFPLPDRPWHGRQDTRAFVQSRAKVYDHCQEACRQSQGIAFSWHWAEDRLICDADLEGLDALARSLAAAVAVDLDRGDWTRAGELLGRMIRLCQVIEHAPSIESARTRRRLIELTCRLVACACSFPIDSDDVLGRLEIAMAPLEARSHFIRTLVVERARLLTGPWGGRLPLTDALASTLRFPHRNFIGRLIELARQPIPESMPLADGIHPPDPVFPLDYFGTAEHVSVSARDYFDTTRVDALLMLAKVAVHLKRNFLQANSGWKDLDLVLFALQEKGFVDPYCLRPVRYRIDGVNVVLYCVGPNLVDDGGGWNPWTSRDDDVRMSVAAVREPNRVEVSMNEWDFLRNMSIAF